jgi:hypothetical protein
MLKRKLVIYSNRETWSCECQLANYVEHTGNLVFWCKCFYYLNISTYVVFHHTPELTSPARTSESLRARQCST